MILTADKQSYEIQLCIIYYSLSLLSNWIIFMKFLIILSHIFLSIGYTSYLISELYKTWVRLSLTLGLVISLKLSNKKKD